MDEPLADVGEVGDGEGLGERRVRSLVRRHAVVLGDNDCELVGPVTAAGALQPLVLSRDRPSQRSADVKSAAASASAVDQASAVAARPRSRS